MIRRLLLASVVPLGFLWLAFQFKEARGPYWLGSNSDPEYAYLLNALMVAEGRAPAHNHHPGTTLQTFGGAILRVVHQLDGQGIFRDDVLHRPEHYLDAIHLGLSALSFLLLLGTGLLVLRQGGDPLCALLLQASPFLSKESIACASRVHPEAMLLSLVSLFAALLYCGLRSKTEESRRWACLLGLVAGISLATKITFLPLLLIPFFLLADGRSRRLFTGFTLLAAVLGILPILSRLLMVVDWMSGLLLRSGHYGTGPVDPFRSGYFKGLQSLLISNPAFAFQLALGLLLTIWLWSKRTSESSEQKATRRVMTGVLTAEILLWSLTARQSYLFARYLLPASCLFGLTLVLSRDVWGRGHRARFPALLILLGIGLSRGQDLRAELLRLQLVKEDQIRTFILAETRFPQSPKVYFFRASSVQHALFFGNGHAGFLYTRSLSRLYPKSYFYNIWARDFSDFAKRIPIQRLWKLEPEFLLQGGNLSASKNFRFPVQTVFQGYTESLFRINPSALGLFREAEAPGSKSPDHAKTSGELSSADSSTADESTPPASGLEAPMDPNPEPESLNAP